MLCYACGGIKIKVKRFCYRCGSTNVGSLPDGLYKKAKFCEGCRLNKVTTGGFCKFLYYAKPSLCKETPRGRRELLTKEPMMINDCYSKFGYQYEKM